MRRLSVVLLVVLAAACDKKDAPAASAKGAADPMLDEAKQADWSGRALAPVDGVVDGIAFSVQLPDKLTKEEKKGDGTWPGYVTWNTSDGNPFLAPTFTAQPLEMAPATLEEAVQRETAGNDKLVVARKEELQGGGWLITLHEAEKAFLLVEAFRKTADGKTVKFSITQRTEKPMAAFDAEKAWAEKVALSFSLK